MNKTISIWVIVIDPDDVVFAGFDEETAQQVLDKINGYPLFTSLKIQSQQKKLLPLEPCFQLKVRAIFKLHTFEKITQDLILTITVVFMIWPTKKRA